MEDLNAGNEIVQARDKLVSIYERLAARRDGIERQERYYDGEQPLTFASAKWMAENGRRFDAFSDNWCAAVTNAEAERIELTGLILPSDGGQMKIASKLWDTWRINEMEMQASQGVLQTLNTSRSYVLVWGDENDKPVVTWEHPSNVEIEYNWMNPRVRDYAVKSWVDEKVEYGILYTPEFLWKFRRDRSTQAIKSESQALQARGMNKDSGGWSVWDDPADDVWPIPNPIGVVPIVEVPNRPKLRGEPVSEIQTVMPMQDAINILWAYAMHAADFASMPARVLLGTNPPMRPVMNDKGEVVGTKPITMEDLNEARMAVFSGENAKIDSWPAAQLDVFTDTIEIAVGHIAAQTRTPPHYLVSNKGLANLAADALKAAEIGLVKKTQEFQKFAGPALREVFRLMALVSNDTSMAEQVRLAQMAWKNPEIRSEAQLADAILKKKQAGYPFEYLMQLDGISPQQQKNILEMRKREQSAALEQMTQGGFDDAFGGSGGEPPSGSDSADPGDEPADS